MAEACGGRGKGGQAEREAGPTARWGVGSIHWGNLWRVSIKAVDELTFKETMALGQAVRAELERSW